MREEASPSSLARNSRAEYTRRMHRVLEHIDSHLDRELDLVAVAAVAHFSPYHFHRLFAAWMGETLGEYLRRRRLEVAAMRLASQPRLSVLQAALSVGFGSAEAFTRAFKARFDCAPTAWRTREAQRRQAHRNPDQMDRNADQAHERPASNHGVLVHPESEASMNVRLVDRQPATVAYLRHVGPYGEPLSRFWMQTVAPWVRENGLYGRARYGISHDDPSITDPQKCRYDACAEVPDGFVATRGALMTTLPGGRYAALDFKGTAAQIGAAWTALLRDWLPSSGLQLDARPCFEHYPQGATFDTNTGVFDCEICIPVAPL